MDKSKVVPIDLQISGDGGHKSLIITGPNGGGKTLALKSFGLAAVMSKLGIPIPVQSVTKRHGSTTRNDVIVDFFADILVEVGDQQSVINGESTLIARLNACSSIIQQVCFSPTDDVHDQGDGGFVKKNSTAVASSRSSLILLDELGGGTDPEAGAALAQAILEQLLEIDASRIVATTHSPKLKALAINDDRYNCASVLLEDDSTSNDRYKLPTFQLAYGSVGDSYALGAASRCDPPLPNDILSRAADLMAGGDEGEGSVLRAMSTSIEREKEALKIETKLSEDRMEETILARDAMRALAKSYEDRFSRLEKRLEVIFEDLKQDDARDAFDIIGDSLAEVRIAKKKVLTERDALAEMGLKSVTPLDELYQGERVVIIAKGEWEGMIAFVAANEKSETNVKENEIAVIPSHDWEFSAMGDFQSDSTAHSSFFSDEGETLILNRNEIAVWDYPGDMEFDYGDTASTTSKRTNGVSESKQALYGILSNLNSKKKTGPPSSTTTKTKASYVSARNRKAARAVSKKDKKGPKKKKK